MADRNYTVTLRYQYPAWDEKDGIPYEVYAKSKSAAVSRVRKMADADGHTMSGKGRITFTAKEAAA